jgi:choline dehydrogenase-like flavoprotein
LQKGKGVGGTSIINYMVYSRGHKSDFGHETGWSYDEVLPYFKKFEQMTIDNLKNPDIHGLHGPINIEYSNYRSEFADVFIEASKTLGQKVVDYNSGEQLGVSYLQTTTKKGHRNSAFKAYIKPIVRRPNLDIMVRTYATKILINDDNVAYGVEVLRNGKKIIIKAKKEVIVSAGSYKSPQILMLSGIGPKSMLDSFSIPVVSDLPVGKNLKDHVALFGPTFTMNTSVLPYGWSSIGLDSMIQYSYNEGKLTVPSAIEALSFIRTDGKKTGVPDIELIFTPTSFHTSKENGLRKLIGLSYEIYDAVYKPLENRDKDAFDIISVLLDSHSKGSVSLIDGNPLSSPKIDLKFLDDSKDVDKFLKAIKYILKLSKTPAFKKYNPKLHDIPLPPCKHLKFASDDYWRCFIKSLTNNLWHPIGTCKMGRRSDKSSVVSRKLKVYGVKHLRVADCSVIPEIPTSHTMANAYVIGERASAIIKEQWT